MNEFSALALFCSDVREERAGTRTLVGVFPDSVTFSKLPAAIPQMVVYVRIHLRSDVKPTSVVARVVMPDGSELDQNAFGPELIEQAYGKASANGYAGLIGQFGVAPLIVNAPGTMKAFVVIDGGEHLAGALNFVLATPKGPTT